MSNEKGRFGEFGGQYIPETLMNELIRLEERYNYYKKDPEFLRELETLMREYAGRPSMLYFAEKIQKLRDLGQKDIILDPGFGFGKTVEENYAVMNGLERMQMTRLPVLVGISRKSMINRLLGIQPEQALNGTTVLNTLALLKGASILRVHDVREAVECVRVVAAATQSQHTVNDKQ